MISQIYEDLKEWVYLEINDEITRTKVHQMLEQYLGTEKYQVVCDETNNPPELVDKYQLCYSLIDKQTNHKTDYIFSPETYYEVWNAPAGYVPNLESQKMFEKVFL